jgi:hypothetical protein
MNKPLFSVIAASAIAIGIAGASTHERTATLTSNGVSGSGKCTVEVVVPGTAEIKIEGSSASLQKFSGRDPEWRRFECTSALPEKPVAFRLESVGGRGRQELVHGPRHHGGSAKIFIHDHKRGEDTYTFNIVWDAESTEP